MMDHKEAQRAQVCERYLLGELVPAERDAFEEHYFSCPACAAELRSAAELLGAAKQIFAASPAPPGPVPAPVRTGFGWFARWKPAYAAGALAVLLLLLGYQNLVTIPRYKQAASSRVLPVHSLIAANTLGDDGQTFTVRPDEPFGLYVDAPYDPAFSVYRLVLRSPSGATVSLRSLDAAEAQKTQILVINPGRQAGKYTIVVSGLSGPNADPASAKELALLQFTVAFAK